MSLRNFKDASIIRGMSFEHFKELGAPYLLQRVQREPGTSPVETVALSLIDAGRNGMDIYAESKADRKTGVLYLTDDFWEGLNSQHSQDLGAFALGISQIGISDALVTKRFSSKQHYSLWNSHATGLPFLQFSAFPPDDVEELTHDKWRQMVALAKENPSLTSFFLEQNIPLLPTPLSNFIRSYSLTKHIRSVLGSVMDISVDAMPQTYINSIKILRHQRQIESFDAKIATAQSVVDVKKEGVLKNVLAKQEREIAEGIPAAIPIEDVFCQIPALDMDVEGGFIAGNINS